MTRLVGASVRRDVSHFRRGPDEDANLFAGVFGEARLQHRFDLRLGLAAGEDDVAARDIGLHLGEVRVGAERPQVFHRQLARAADIHRTQESNETRHRQGLEASPSQRQ